MKNLQKEIDCTERLIKEVEVFRKLCIEKLCIEKLCIEAKVISSKELCLTVAISSAWMALPNVLKEKKKVMTKFKRRLK